MIYLDGLWVGKVAVAAVAVLAVVAVVAAADIVDIAAVGWHLVGTNVVAAAAGELVEAEIVGGCSGKGLSAAAAAVTDRGWSVAIDPDN